MALRKPKRSTTLGELIAAVYDEVARMTKDSVFANRLAAARVNDLLASGRVSTPRFGLVL